MDMIFEEQIVRLMKVVGDNPVYQLDLFRLPEDKREQFIADEWMKRTYPGIFIPDNWKR